MSNQQNEEAKIIKDYLIKKFRASGEDKAYELCTQLLEKIAGKLGMTSYFNLVTGNFPAAKLAKFATGYLVIYWFEGYFSLNRRARLNPHDPVNEEDPYCQYLLYSWARGSAGYIYDDPRGYFPKRG